MADEDRHYLLHVPADCTCSVACPALVDLHGTAGDFAEEAYGLDALLETADAEGFIVLRPRSRFSEEGGYRVYRWDQNPGDLPRNRAFVEALVADLAGRYRVDPARVYVSGFSSGTNMAAQFLGVRPALFAGFAFVGGGFWNDPHLPDWGAASPVPRIYSVTGYRDYMQENQRTLLEALQATAYPPEALFRREVDAGHELYGWHFRELWPWLDRAERPSSVALAPGWTREAGVRRRTACLPWRGAPAAPSLLQARGAPSGAGTRRAGGPWRRV